MAQPVKSPRLGELTILGHPVSWGGKRNPLRKSAPELGEDNQAILTTLGYSADDIAVLEKDGVI
jgi:crotonobetainyl-CoA:carnitine CoA-transferase CaiB-like acyl-CoA transferase